MEGELIEMFGVRNVLREASRYHFADTFHNIHCDSVTILFPMKLAKLAHGIRLELGPFLFYTIFSFVIYYRSGVKMSIFNFHFHPV